MDLNFIAVRCRFLFFFFLALSLSFFLSFSHPHFFIFFFCFGTPIIKIKKNPKPRISPVRYAGAYGWSLRRTYRGFPSSSHGRPRWP
jgi:hypothetical protein